jgi:hypothetical protein
VNSVLRRRRHVKVKQSVLTRRENASKNYRSPLDRLGEYINDNQRGVVLSEWENGEKNSEGLRRGGNQLNCSGERLCFAKRKGLVCKSVREQVF